MLPECTDLFCFVLVLSFPGAVKTLNFDNGKRHAGAKIWCGGVWETNIQQIVTQQFNAVPHNFYLHHDYQWKLPFQLQCGARSCSCQLVCMMSCGHVFIKRKLKGTHSSNPKSYRSARFWLHHHPHSFLGPRIDFLLYSQPQNQEQLQTDTSISFLIYTIWWRQRRNCWESKLRHLWVGVNDK